MRWPGIGLARPLAGPLPPTRYEARIAPRGQKILAIVPPMKPAAAPRPAPIAAPRGGAQLVVTTLDRLGRSLEHLIVLSVDLQARGGGSCCARPGDRHVDGGRMFLDLGAIAEFEHALLSERTRDGLAAARARARTGGQKPKLFVRQADRAGDVRRARGPTGGAPNTRGRSPTSSASRAQRSTATFQGPHGMIRDPAERVAAEKNSQRRRRRTAGTTSAAATSKTKPTTRAAIGPTAIFKIHPTNATPAMTT